MAGIFSPPGGRRRRGGFPQGGVSINDLHLAPPTLERRALLRALRALKKGDFAVRMPLDMIGIDAEIAQAFNDVVELNQSIAEELARVCRDAGREGQINQRMRGAAAGGSWASQVDSVNELIGDLVRPAGAGGRGIESVANGDSSPPMLLGSGGVAMGR